AIAAFSNSWMRIERGLPRASVKRPSTPRLGKPKLSWNSSADGRSLHDGTTRACQGPHEVTKNTKAREVIVCKRLRVSSRPSWLRDKLVSAESCGGGDFDRRPARHSV